MFSDRLCIEFTSNISVLREQNFSVFFPARFPWEREQKNRSRRTLIGIDLILKTIPNELMDKRKWIDDEEEMRQMMTLYAINNCLAVPKLIVAMILNQPKESTIHHGEESEAERIVKHDQNEEQIIPHSANDAYDGNVRDESYPIVTGGHGWNETLEEVSDDKLPEIMEHHFHHKEDQPDEQRHNTLSDDENGAEEEIHGSNESSK